MTYYKLFLLLVSILTSAFPLNATSMICGYCHGNVFSLSGMKSKEEWRVLTSDKNTKLQEIHKYNLGVLAYLQSPQYQPKKLYEYVEFHANKVSDIELNKVLDACLYCHDTKMSLSSLWSKKQWDALSSSLNPLIEIHKSELKVLSEIQSPRFEKTLAQFIKSMRFHARDTISEQKSIYTNNSYNPMELKKFAFKNKNIEFIYEKVEGQEAEAKMLYIAMKNIISPCKLANPIKFILKHKGWKFNGRDTFFWILTFSLSDVRTTLSLTLEAEYQGQNYTISDSLTHRKSWFNAENTNHSMLMLLERLSTKIIEEIGLECKEYRRYKMK